MSGSYAAAVKAGVDHIGEAVDAPFKLLGNQREEDLAGLLRNAGVGIVSSRETCDTSKRMKTKNSSLGLDPCKSRRNGLTTPKSLQAQTTH